MKNSRDLTLVIFFAVVSFVYTAFVGQMGTLITGIPGTNYLFVVGHAIFISSALLLYRGKRWRFFVQSVLFILLTIPTYFAGAPFDVVARIPIIFNNFIGDLLFNSLYGFFERRERLVWWAILAATGITLMNPIFVALIWRIIFPPEFVTTFLNVALLMLPVIIIESTVGELIGYKVYERVRKVEKVDS